MRKTWDIHGGIHPAENKHQSNQIAITAAGIPEQLVFPLSQHIGTPASAIVSVGQTVLKGEMIAAAKGFVSVPVHASTSGEVIAIEQRTIPHPSGMSAPCIVIKPDGNDQWIEHTGLEDYTRLEKNDLLNHIRESGIAGMGGAGFPAAVKLGTRDDQVIESLIINGTECEPYITSDDMLMRERAEEIIAGIQILKHLIKPTKEAVIGVEDNKPEAIAALEKAAKGSGIEIVSFPTKYPSGGEKQLIQILTGKEVPSGGLPAQVGIVCQNIGTTVAIYRSVTFGEPLISRITTVTGDACKQQRNYEVLLGTPINHLLDLAGYQEKKCSRLIMGGPMMGFTLDDETAPIVKTTNCILAPTPKEIPPPTPAQACIRCGMCSEACPVSLLPQQMYWFARGKEYEKLESHNLMDCIECGACSFACPSNIPLVQYYRASKAEIRQQKQDAIKAEQSKARFEARQERIERQEKDKEAKRAARKAAAQARAAGNTDGKVDAVQAAVDRAKAKKSAADPAQAAIEKALAKRTGDSDDKPTKESLEKALASVEKRLTAAKEKCQKAEQEDSDKIEAFRSGVEKTEQKYQKAKHELEQFVANNADVSNAKSDSTPSSNDPAQLAIERARDKRAGQEKLSPRQKAEQSVDSLKARIEKSQLKLSEAVAENSDNLAIFESTLGKLQEKLTLAEDELAAIPLDPPQIIAEPTVTKGDAAQDAIARALAKREAASSMSDEDRLKNAVAAIDKRINKAREKLAAAEEEGSENIAILSESVGKLEIKLIDAKQAYESYNQQP
jgi:electron transport complex protein RnfC